LNFEQLDWRENITQANITQPRDHRERPKMTLHQDFMIPVGLPNERWTLEAKLSEPYLTGKLAISRMQDTSVAIAHSSLKPVQT
jgi:hypothetical protein